MDIAHDDWREGGPWWLMRCLGRYLLAFLVLAPALSLLFPAPYATGEDGDPTYGQGVVAAIFTTWILLMVVGIWAVVVLLVLVGLRRRMERSPFRGLAGFLLCLPLILMPLLGGPSVTLIYFGVHVLFASVLMPTTDAAPVAPASSPGPAVPAPRSVGADWNTYFQFAGGPGLRGDGTTDPPARPRP